LAKDGAPKNWSSTYGQKHLAPCTSNFDIKVWSIESQMHLALFNLVDKLGRAESKKLLTIPSS